MYVICMHILGNHSLHSMAAKQTLVNENLKQLHGHFLQGNVHVVCCDCDIQVRN